MSYILDGKFAFLKAGKSAAADIVSDRAVLSLVYIACLAVMMYKYYFEYIFIKLSPHDYMHTEIL